MILLTGATGFLGSRIARLILDGTDHQLAVLVRGRDDAHARRRLDRQWHGWSGLRKDVATRVRVIRGDMALPKLGLTTTDYTCLAGEVTHIIHAAAELALDGNIDDLRRVNVGGTAELLALARRAREDHAFGRFAHVSTAYVAGRRTGEIAEEELSESGGFFNAYEQTKFEGERIVREAMSKLPVSVFRPGMVVGDSLTGEIDSFNTVYVPIRLYLTGKMPLVPARPEMPLNIVPVDYVAEAIVRLTFDERAIGRTFHLTVERQHLPDTKVVLDAARSWAAKHLGCAPPRARFVPQLAAMGTALAGRLGVPAVLMSYFGERRIYRRDNTNQLLGSYAPDWRMILPQLLAFAVSKGFLYGAGRTVHEQLVYRLQSRKLPVRIHDLAAGTGLATRSGAEMCREIGHATAALRALGIVPGDRVALVGCNSSRFLSIDTAIGLAGAVSVPLYYTSPVNEIGEILRISGAKLLFIGAPAVLDRASELDATVRVVSFCTSPARDETAKRVLPWEDFLLAGEKAARDGDSPTSPVANRVTARPFALNAPVDFSDLATLRFTSGTTGVPKGVEFRHGQVRWLAETIAALLPWKARTTSVRYLSFLPMNHVVEGIMGMYAPSYIPAPVDICFLDDFHLLARTLPQVRPTVFFSVPRFYEKVWSSFAKSTAGRAYVSLQSKGVLRRAVRRLVRTVLLRRAGIDKCAQLIVGSAPSPEGLLENFSELGIEICNAYGLTEAPLITMNRYNSNRLGTVGTPLPETEVRIAADGEVLVRGPQVTNGYFGATKGDPPDNGWLHTGDLGEIDANGSLIISGRKKEMLVTSYGKNIFPRKIENMLCRIPGMSEAMVIGDKRPSLSALLWPVATPDAFPAFEEIDNAVRRMNCDLSHPEQVKRWAVVSERPTIENGELTGNLKLRRQAVLSRRVEIVDLLYGDRLPYANSGTGISSVAGVLHVGKA